ncbi:unnamed protein product [Amaranthus hypochondriacus]
MVKGKKDYKKKTKDVQNETIEEVQRDCDPIESTSVLNNNDEETLVVEASSSHCKAQEKGNANWDNNLLQPREDRGIVE